MTTYTRRLDNGQHEFGVVVDALDTRGRAWMIPKGVTDDPISAKQAADALRESLNLALET